MATDKVKEIEERIADLKAEVDPIIKTG